MQTRILGISGKKQSGKTSAANYLVGYVMKLKGVIEKFDVDSEGKLFVNAESIDAKGNRVPDWGWLDLERRDEDFVRYASDMIWPHIRVYNIADTLKETVHHMFGIPFDLLYGTDADKESLTNIEWDHFFSLIPARNIPKLKENGYAGTKMSIRHLLQYFGDICRKIDEECLIRATLNRIEEENPEIAVVPDVRFAVEVNKIHAEKGITARLNRSIYADEHVSETELDKFKPNQFTIFINNNDMTIQDKHEEMLSKLIDAEFIMGVK